MRKRIVHTIDVSNQTNSANREWGKGRHVINEWEHVRTWSVGLNYGECWWDEVGETGEPQEKPQKSRHCPPQLIPCRYRVSSHYTFPKRINIYQLNRARWLRGNAWDSHSGGPGLKSRCRPTWLGFFVVFPNNQGKCWVRFSLARSIWPLFIKFRYHKIKSVNLTNETLTTQQ